MSPSSSGKLEQVVSVCVNPGTLSSSSDLGAVHLWGLSSVAVAGYSHFHRLPLPLCWGDFHWGLF